MALVDRDVAPRDDRLPLRLDRLGEEPLERCGALGLAGQEADRDAVAAERRQRGADLGAEQRVRQLERHARAVAGEGVGALGAPVLEVGERGRGAHERLVTRHAVQTGDERDAAGVVLVRRVVEADCLHTVPPPLTLSPDVRLTGEARGAGSRLARTRARKEGGLERQNPIGSYERSLHRFPV